MKRGNTSVRFKHQAVSLNKRDTIIPAAQATQKRSLEYSKKVMDELLEGKKVVPSISKYEFVKEIGEGAQGAVFVGHQISECGIKKKIAIKVIKEEYGEKEIKRLVSEAKLLALLTQGNVVEMIALESVNISNNDNSKIYLLIQELIDGQSLEKLLIQHKKKNLLMNPALVGFTLYKAALALDEAHNLKSSTGKKLNLIHRSLSPSNILYNDKAGIIKLSDFGMATLDDQELSADKLRGKPAYMAPEQFQQRNFACTDIWALGVIGYEALTGFLPYQISGSTLSGAVERLIKQSHFELRSPAEILNPKESNLPLKKLSDIIMSCLNPNGHKRPTADELQHRLASEYLYASGLGPTTRTLASYLALIKEMPAQKDIVVSDIKLDPETEKGLIRTLHIKKPIEAIQYRTAKAFQPEMLKAIQAKETNPCLKPKGNEIFKE